MQLDTSSGFLGHGLPRAGCTLDDALPVMDYAAHLDVYYSLVYRFGCDAPWTGSRFVLIVYTLPHRRALFTAFTDCLRVLRLTLRCLQFTLLDDLLHRTAFAPWFCAFMMLDEHRALIAGGRYSYRVHNWRYAGLYRLTHGLRLVAVPAVPTPVVQLPPFYRWPVGRFTVPFLIDSRFAVITHAGFAVLQHCLTQRPVLYGFNTGRCTQRLTCLPTADVRG